jgi:preprotein translocase subunit SecE
VAEKTVKAKQPDKIKQTGSAVPPEKPKAVQKTAARAADKDREKPKQPNAIARWWRETVGELRKVSWPSTHDAWRLTRIVLVVMFIMSAILGILDYVFSWLIALLVS